MKIKPIIAEVAPPAATPIRAPLNAWTGTARGLFSVGESLERASGDLERTGRIRQAVEEKQKEYDDLFAVAGLHVAAKGKIAEHSDNWQTVEYGKVLGQAETDLGALKTDLLDRARQEKMSPEALKRFEKEWVQIQGQALLDARKIDDRKFKEKSRENLSSLLDTSVKESVTMSASGREKHFQNLDRLVDRMMGDGMITGLEASAYKKNLRTGADAQIKSVMEEIRKQEEKQKETDVYVYLKEKHGEDYDGMQAELQTPALLKKSGITVEKAANLRNILKAESVKTEENKKAVYHQTAVLSLNLLREDRLSKDHLDEFMAQDRLDMATGEKLKKAIDEKYASPDGKIKTDPVTFANLFSMAHTTTDREAVKREILKNVDKLEEADVEKLLTKAEATYEAAENRRISRGVEYIRNTVIPKRGQMEKFLSTPEEEKDLKDALDSFDAKLSELKKTGKPVSAEDIDKAARETAQSHSKTIYERMKGMTEYMRQQMKPTPAGKKEEHVVGQVYEDAAGRKAKYLGKDKWELQP